MPANAKLAQPGDDQSGAVPRALLAHYDAHARVLPWRTPPGAAERPDPYRVWLSEIMLQQTTVAAVIPYFERFTARWPTVEALANARDEDLMAAWAGLGYYARARNLLACARHVAGPLGGVFPDDLAGLRALPGVGDYTAAAIAAIAFGRQVAVVDANIERVVARLFAIETPLPAAKAEIRAHMERLTPADRPGDFAQAMMDLGAGICSVRRPACLTCPLLPHCAAGKTGSAEGLPVKPPKKAKPERRGQAWWIEHKGQVLLVTRPAKGMLAGMRALPDNDWSARGDGSGDDPHYGPWRRLPAAVRHSFTHFDLVMDLALVRSDDLSMQALARRLGGQFWPLDNLGEAGLPTLYARLAEAAQTRGRIKEEE